MWVQLLRSVSQSLILSWTWWIEPAMLLKNVLATIKQYAFLMNSIVHLCIYLFTEQWTDLLHLFNDVWESSSTDVCQIGVPTALLLQLQLTNLWLQTNNEAFYFLLASIWIPLVSGMILFFKNSEASALRTRVVKLLCFPSTSALFLRMDTSL
jgi:hypothetical protein